MSNEVPTTEAYGHAAWMLDCEARVLRAIAAVEAGPQGAFDDLKRPTILFERHVFDRLTLGKYRFMMFENAPISSPTPGGYGHFSEQYPKLEFASTLDLMAARMACSWGLFQIMGENFERAGFDSVAGMVATLHDHVDEHLRALVMFVRSDGRLLSAIRLKNWGAFAYSYNGPNYQKNHYAERIAKAYEELGQ